MAVLDIHVNDGAVPIVDGSLVYHCGFGDRRTALNDPKPALALSPRVITANGRVVESRTYPLGTPLPPHGRPSPLRPAVHRPGSSLPGVGTGPACSAPDADRGDWQHHREIGSGQVAPGKTKLLRLPAPRPGTYLFTDPGNQPVERTLGLDGALVPRNVWRLAPARPSSNASGCGFDAMWTRTGPASPRGGGLKVLHLRVAMEAFRTVGRVPRHSPSCATGSAACSAIR
jgi:hypothetical protein